MSDSDEDPFSDASLLLLEQGIANLFSPTSATIAEFISSAGESECNTMTSAFAGKIADFMESSTPTPTPTTPTPTPTPDTSIFDGIDEIEESVRESNSEGESKSDGMSENTHSHHISPRTNSRTDSRTDSRTGSRTHTHNYPTRSKGMNQRELTRVLTHAHF